MWSHAALGRGITLSGLEGQISCLVVPCRCSPWQGFALSGLEGSALMLWGAIQVQPLAGLLPYKGWTLRPVGGRGSGRVALDIITSQPGGNIS